MLWQWIMTQWDRLPGKTICLRHWYIHIPWYKAHVMALVTFLVFVLIFWEFHVCIQSILTPSHSSLPTSRTSLLLPTFAVYSWLILKRDSMQHPPLSCMEVGVTVTGVVEWVARLLSVFIWESDVKGCAAWLSCRVGVHFTLAAPTVFRRHVTLSFSTGFSHGNAVALIIEPGDSVMLLRQKDGCL